MPTGRCGVCQWIVLWSLVLSFCFAQSTTTVSPATNSSAGLAAPSPRVELTWEGIFVMVTVILMILAMAFNLVASLPALFFISTLYTAVGIITLQQFASGLVNSGMLAIALMFVIVNPVAKLPMAIRAIEKVLRPLEEGSSDAADETARRSPNAGSNPYGERRPGGDDPVGPAGNDSIASGASGAAPLQTVPSAAPSSDLAQSGDSQIHRNGGAANQSFGNNAATLPAQQPQRSGAWRAMWPRLKLLAFSYVITPFLGNVPQVSVMTPVVTRVCRAFNIPTSQMLLPMAMCICTTNFLAISSASNLIIQSLMEEAGSTPMGFFELVKTNGPVSLLLLPFYIFAAPLLLPDNSEAQAAMDSSASPLANKNADGPHHGTTPHLGMLPVVTPVAGGETGATQHHRTNSSSGGGGSDPHAHGHHHHHHGPFHHDPLAVPRQYNKARDFTVHMRVPKDGASWIVGKHAMTLLHAFPVAVRRKVDLLFIMRRRKPLGMFDRSIMSASGLASSINRGNEEEMQPASGLRQRQATTALPAESSASVYSRNNNDVARVGVASRSLTDEDPQDRDPDAYDVIILRSDVDGGNDRHGASAVAPDTVIAEDDILVFAGDATQLRALRNLAGLYWVVADLPDRDLRTNPQHRGVQLPSGGPSLVDFTTVDFGAGADHSRGRRDEEALRYQVHWPAGLVTINAARQARSAPFASVIVSSANPVVATRVGDNLFSRLYQSSILAIKTPYGEHIWGRDMAMHIINVGDTILIRTTVDFIDAQGVLNSDFFVVDPIGLQVETLLTAHYVRVPVCMKRFAGDRVTVRGETAYLRLPDWYPNLVLLVFIGVIAAAMAGVTLPLACAVGICVMVIIGLVTVSQAVQLVEWNVYVTGAMAFGIGAAMSSSGLAAWIGQGIRDAGVSGFPLILLLIGLTGLIANVVSDRGAVQVMFPVALALFRGNLLPGAVAVAVGALGAFLTPYGLTTSLIVAGPGGYTPKNYIVFGLPLFIIYVLSSATMVSIVYGIW